MKTTVISFCEEANGNNGILRLEIPTKAQNIPDEPPGIDVCYPCLSYSGMNRRTFINQLAGAGAGGLIPLSTVAGSSHLTEGGAFSFAVVSDLHHASETCDPWFERVVDKVKAENPAFCVLAGDLANDGKESSLLSVREHFSQLGCPLYAVPGNHDCDVTGDTRLYEKVFPDQLNYYFTHGNWQFIALDTTQGTEWRNTRISGSTLDWVEGAAKELDPDRPTVLISHFPLADPIPMTPLNAAELWNRLRPLKKIRMAFCGHHHGQVHVQGATPACTNICCALVRGNFDDDPRRGFWMVHAEAGSGTLSYEVRRVEPVEQA